MQVNKIADCDMCHKLFVGAYYKHDTFPGKQSFICELCHAKFANQQYFTAHNCCYSTEKLFTCNMAHNCNTVDEKSLNCDVFRTEATVNNSAHAIEKSLSCDNEFSHICNTVDKKTFEMSRKKIPKVELTVHHCMDPVEKSFTCEACYKNFSDKESFTAHDCVDVSKIPFTFTKSEKEFSNIISFATHNCFQIGNESFACDICHKEFSNKLCLNEHICTHLIKNTFTDKTDIKNHSEPAKSSVERDSQGLQSGSYNCDVCHKQFNYKKGLVKHLNTRPDESPFTCDACEKQFCFKGEFKIHVEVHGIKDKCDICQKQFTHNIHLIEHLKSRPEDSSFTCVKCGTQFCLKSEFDTHVHTCGCPNKCKVCYKEFNQKHHLKLHLKTHPNESPFHASRKCIECQVCYKVFSGMNLLKLHVARRPKESPFSCPKCEALFCFKKDFNMHFHAHGTEERKVFRKTFSSKKSYMAHNYICEQTLNCVILNKEFAHPESCFQNSIDHNKKSLYCSICDTYFYDIEYFSDHNCNLPGEKCFTTDESHKEITENELSSQDCNFLGEKSLTNAASCKDIPHNELTTHNCNFRVEKSFTNYASQKEIADNELHKCFQVSKASFTKHELNVQYGSEKNLSIERSSQRSFHNCDDVCHDEFKCACFDTL